MYCEVGYDHLHATMRVEILLLLLCCCHDGFLVSRNSHVKWFRGPMRAETLIPEQQSSLHNSTVKGIQTGLRNKKNKNPKNNNKLIFTTFCKHERRQNMADRKLKIWQKKKRKNNNIPKHLEHDTFCALSESSPASRPPSSWFFRV